MEYVVVPPEYEHKEWWDIIKPGRIPYQNFGFEVSQEFVDYLTELESLPGSNPELSDLTGFSQVKDLERIFEICMTLDPFKAKETDITVKHNIVTVRCKQDGKEGRCTVFRELVRSYVLPKVCEPGSATALVENGILTILFKKTDEFKRESVSVSIQEIKDSSEEEDVTRIDVSEIASREEIP